jgi:hypothetical protein
VPDELARAQARIAELEGENAAHRRAGHFATANSEVTVLLDRERLQARVQQLAAALDTAIEALGWASDYISVPWPKPYRIEPLRAALAGEGSKGG